MNILKNFTALIILCFAIQTTGFALDDIDREAIQKVIDHYVEAWNFHECKGFGNDFTVDADFVNIYGMHFSGRAEIEERHVRIMQTFLKGSFFEVVKMQLREVQPGLVVAIVHWRVSGFRTPRSDMNKPAETREGLFSHVFIKNDDKWEITATQNTLIPN